MTDRDIVLRSAGGHEPVLAVRRLNRIERATLMAGLTRVVCDEEPAAWQSSVAPAGLRVIDVIEPSDGWLPVRAVAFETVDGVVVAFRGTPKVPDPSDPSTWLPFLLGWWTNAKGLLRGVPAERISRQYRGLIHAGFAELEQDLRPRWDRLLSSRSLRGRDVWLTGHSQGGALAVLAAGSLLEKDVNLSGTVTFGAPRVGNGEFAMYYGPTVDRYEYQCDIVPLLPPGEVAHRLLTDLLRKLLNTDLQFSMPYKHVEGRCTLLEEDGTLRSGAQLVARVTHLLTALGDDEPGRLWRDHRAGRYFGALHRSLSMPSGQ